jgi:diacylglycerol kinase family enzyme
LEFDEEVSYALDGEIFNAKHIEINIQPRSLKVLSNADEFEDAK